jgi:ABC-2 type transport system ATP-binding protein
MDRKTMVIHPATPTDRLPEGPGLEIISRTDGSLEISYHTSQTTAEQVLQAVHDAGVSIRDVKTEQADLQDVFLNLTRSA